MRFLEFPMQTYFFFDKKIGHHYNVGIFKKISLIRKFKRNVKKINTASSWQEHLQIAAKILQIPFHIKGCIIECGSFKGGSTANLSLVCELVNRKLLVYDSFKGLPEPSSKDKIHYSHLSKRKDIYEKGQYKGELEEVKKNIEKYGCVSVCEFRKGYFEDTLPHLTNKCVLAFLDVDLNSSLKTCLIHIWPKLQEGSYLFSHEAMDTNFVSHFFDKKWWEINLRYKAPGFIGAGTGLPLKIHTGSSIGYTIKYKI